MKEESMQIREMGIDDLAEVEDIEQDSFGDEAWSGTGFLTYLIRDDTLFLSAEENGEIVGYAGLLMVPEEADILNIAVRKDRRQSGIGTALMEELIRRAPEHGVTTIHLEVRESNPQAAALYEKEGFVRTGIRRDYYTNPRENAVTMTRTEVKK
jgi:ribosomal-protein-alanine N-acetyltransferase